MCIKKYRICTLSYLENSLDLKDVVNVTYHKKYRYYHNLSYVFSYVTYHKKNVSNLLIHLQIPTQYKCFSEHYVCFTSQRDFRSLQCARQT